MTFEPGQATLDHALGVTAEQRAELRKGRVPRSIRRQLRYISHREITESWEGGVFLLLAIAFALLLYLGTWLFVLPLLLGCAVQLASWTRGSLHARAVLADRPELRAIEGEVETHRTWDYGYGDIYRLHSSLELQDLPKDGAPLDSQVKERFFLGTDLGRYVVSGWTRLYVVTVPSLAPVYAPFHQQLVAIDVSPRTHITEKPPGREPPSEPYGIAVPAD